MSVVSNRFDLTGKIALVTGGATGIGKAIAQLLVESGAKMLIGSRRTDVVEAAVKEIARATETDETNEAEPQVSGVGLDVTQDNSVQRAIRRAVDLYGTLDILVNCAGFTIRKPTFELSIEEFQSIMDVHVTGSLRCAQAAGRLMREQHAGAIINIASIAGYADMSEITGYTTAKSGIFGLTYALANEWAQFGIRTNAIAPGFVPTDMNRKLIEGTDRGRRVLERTPMGRFGRADEIAGAAVYLASPAASFVNGSILVVDGGFLACGVKD